VTTVPLFSSALAPMFEQYVNLKRSLGRRFTTAIWTLQSLDRFLSDHADTHKDLTQTTFKDWCQTYEQISSGVRRMRMLEVQKFCAYRRRTEPACFLPGRASFPPHNQRAKPYIFSTAEVAKLLRAAEGLSSSASTPIRSEITRLAIVLLFTTGIRRGELLKLTVGDYNRREATLHIRATKFYKSRLLPINAQVADEIERYLCARTRNRLPLRPDTPLIWNARDGGRAYTGTGLLHCLRPLLKKCGIRTLKGQPPRIHDLRHSFAVNALMRWYREGADVESKLPLLSTYLGHGSALSTHHYLHFIEPIRTAASERFARHYGALITAQPVHKGQRP
jgi:integrase/recombinase XerD